MGGVYMFIILISVICSGLVSIISCFTILALKNKKEDLQNLQEIEEKQNPPNNIENHVNKDFSFSNYFCDFDNRWIVSSIQETIKSDKNRFLILKGKTGFGKTHLLFAIQNLFIETHDRVKTYYVSAESFVNEFVSSLKNNTLNDFREKYRTLDVLLIDDFQFFIGKEASQEELFYTLIALQERKAFIGISITTPCNIKNNLSSRLVSLLNHEITIELPKPGLEVKRSKILNICNQNHFILSDEIVNLILSYNYDIPEFTGRFNKLIFYKQMEGDTSISKDDVIKVFEEK